MRLHLLPFISLVGLATITSLSCNNKKGDTSIWLSYTEEGSELYGFTDSKGDVKIQPQFFGYFAAKKFHNIIGAMSKNGDKIEQYYLLKSGERIGQDSLYIFDTKFDCEHEGYIRFRDPQTQYTGLFDSTGRIVISPIYNDLSQVHKGYLIGTRQAQRVDVEMDYGQKVLWVLGVQDLIDLKGQVVVENMADAAHLNLHSLQISDTEPASDSERRIYKGRDGKYYSFIDNKKSFDNFYQQFKKDIAPHFLDHIVVWQDGLAWMDKDADKYLQQKAELFKEFSNYINDSTNVIYINVQNFVPVTEKSFNDWERYRDDCDNWNTMEYPIFEIAYPLDGDKFRSLYCLKTEKGFKIVGLRFDE